MKRKLIRLIAGVLVLSLAWQGGYLQRILMNVGKSTAGLVLSRGYTPGESITLETEQGYEDGLFVAPSKSADTGTSGAPVVNLGINNGKYAVIRNVSVKNSTSKSIDIGALLEKGFTKPKLSSDKPAVLIYHTHTTESYEDAGAEYSDDTDKGVVGVGKAMKAVFESHGLKTVHLTDNFMKGGSFNKAYTRSLAGVEAVLKKYPSIQIVLDIHRDSITQNGTEYCPLTEIDGQEYAQVMIISGTDELGLSHDGWRQNLSYALKLVETLQKDFPGLSRPLNLNANRYNTHTTPFALLLEVGGGANTSVQAKRSGAAVAESICKIVH